MISKRECTQLEKEGNLASLEMTSGGLELKSLAVKLRAAYRCQWEIGHGVTTSVLELWLGLGASEGNSETAMHTEAIQIDLSPMKRQQGIIEAGQKKK